MTIGKASRRPFIYGSVKKRGEVAKQTNDIPSPSLTKEEVSTRLTTYRKVEKITQKQLAERMGVSLRALQSWEQKRSVPSLVVQKQILNL